MSTTRFRSELTRFTLPSTASAFSQQEVEGRALKVSSREAMILRMNFQFAQVSVSAAFGNQCKACSRKHLQPLRALDAIDVLHAILEEAPPHGVGVFQILLRGHAAVVKIQMVRDVDAV